MKKISAAVDRAIALMRQGLLFLVSDQGLYLFTAFLFGTVFNSRIFQWYSEIVNVLSSYAVIPWGVALCVLRLRRADVRDLRSADTGLLTLLLLWLVVPFFIRYGATFNNVTSWNSHCVLFFAVYALTREDAPHRRAAMLDRVCALFAVLSVVAGAALLYAAWTLRAFGPGTRDWTFGIFDSSLCAGYDRNSLGMNATCCLMMCIVGVCRRKSLVGKLAHAVPAVMMLVVVVLTQSRASRYAVLLALAAGTYGAVAASRLAGKGAVRHAAGIACAVFVLLAGYIAAGRLTDAAVAHYTSVQQSRLAQAAASATAAPEQIPETAAPAASAAPEQIAETAAPELPAQAAPVVAVNPSPTPVKFAARVAVDSTLNDRTNLWKNLFAFWRENPKYMVIGLGTGRIGRIIAPGTSHEWKGTAAVHNGFLQFAADYGLIGLALLLAFFLSVLRPVLRVFFARGESAYPGGRALCMLVIAVLANAMVETPPLAAMSPMNMLLFYALAILCAQGRGERRGTERLVKALPAVV